MFSLEGPSSLEPWVVGSVTAGVGPCDVKLKCMCVLSYVEFLDLCGCVGVCAFSIYIGVLEYLVCVCLCVCILGFVSILCVSVCICKRVSVCTCTLHTITSKNMAKGVCVPTVICHLAAKLEQ
jgi:hypothetical protein